jgi:hypothetical protein
MYCLHAPPYSRKTQGPTKGERNEQMSADLKQHPGGMVEDSSEPTLVPDIEMKRF